MSTNTLEHQHAALWLIGPDMPGLLRLGSEWVRDHGGNIDKDIADKFGEKAVLFMSITAKPEDIARMDHDKTLLRDSSRCGVVFQPMSEPTVPEGYEEDLHGFDIVTDDSPGLIAKVTSLTHKFGMLIVGHTGERSVRPGPRPQVQAGQKFVVMLPHDFDHLGFTKELNELIHEYKGTMRTPLQSVPGLLWWW